MPVKVLKFSASWCPPCKALSTSLGKITTDILTEEIDVDNDPVLAASYNIRSVPVLIAIKDGLEVQRLSGSQTHQSLQNWYNKLVLT